MASGFLFLCTRAIQKVTSGDLLTKQAMRKKNVLCTKNTYMLKGLLSIVTTGIQALVILGNNFLYACVKEVCYLWVQPLFETFHQLLIFIKALRSQPVLQVHKQVVVYWSEIRAVRWMVKELSVEMLQQCCSVSSCMQMRVVMEEQYEYTGYQHCTPFVQNGPT
jgi:hypothetical protein